MLGLTSPPLAKAQHISLVAGRRGNMTSDGLHVPPFLLQVIGRNPGARESLYSKSIQVPEGA